MVLERRKVGGHAPLSSIGANGSVSWTGLSVLPITVAACQDRDMNAATRRWSSLSRTAQAGIVDAGTVQLATLVDLARRNRTPSTVHVCSGLQSPINFGRPTAYFIFGRRRTQDELSRPRTGSAIR